MEILKKLKRVLSKKQKNKVIILLFMIILGALLETVGISMIVPIISAIIQPNAMEENELIKLINNIFHFTDINQLVIGMIIVMIIVFVVKNSYMLLMYNVQYSFICNSQYSVSRDLLKIYLNKPYEFYLSANTSDILRTVYSDTTGVFSLLLQCIQLVTEIVVAICIGAVLMVIDFKMTMVITILLGGTTILISKVLKPKLQSIGFESREKQSKMYGGIIQSVMGIKDVKVFDKTKYFLDFYKKHGKRYYKLSKDNAVIGAMPKLLIETVSIAGILTYLAIMISAGNNITEMLPQLSAFAIAASRLMPCANRASTYLASIAYYKPTLDFVYQNVEVPDSSVLKEENITQTEIEKLTFKTKIQLQGISYKYPNTEKFILKGANMEISAGKSVGIVGPSGSGKTTTVDIILGLLRPEEGSILCDDKSIFENYPGWLHNIGYIPQSISMMDDTIKANVAFGVAPEQVSEQRVREVLEEAQLTQFIEELPEGIETKIGERGVRLSGGQRQRIAIARALYHNPELLILDEATSALDNDTELAIMEAINHFRGKKTMLIIAHRLKTIENCDMIYCVKDGQVSISEKR